MSIIPGLDPIPIGNETAPVGEEIKFNDMNGDEFVVPEAHRYGTCRPENEFKKIDNVGEGSFGKVYKAKDLKKDDVVAMKKIKVADKTVGLSKSFLREVNILKELHNENIVNLLDIACAKDLDYVFLVMEYCPYELSNVIDDLILTRKSFDPPHIKCIMSQLFSGLRYCHSYYVIHRDLKISNILFSQNGCLKIADFGMSRKVSSGSMTPARVSLWYRAPEILLGATNYTTAVDVWQVAAGCIFAELILKAPLFRGDYEMEVITQLVEILGVPTEQIWKGCSELLSLQLFDLKGSKYNKLANIFQKESHSCLSLIQGILLYCPEKRYTAGKCLKQEYFREEPIACSLPELTKLLLLSKET